MIAADFDLQHSTTPQPTLLDEEISTTNWPMPPVKPWAPIPQLAPNRKLPGLLERIAEVFR